MCCIFTWLAWAFDATHRIVVFFMACMISSSICCLLLTASLAGVAMGYNYSLAEYIDLKETNISVYIKRGVYDDEISDDFDWRRQGGGEPTIIHKDTGLRTAGSDDQNSLAPGRRRMADSIFESDDQHKYEGALMRLTSTPTVLPLRRFQPEPPYTTSQTTARNLVDGLLAVADNLPGGSMDRLKAIQAAARHHEARKIELATAQFPEDASERQRVIVANAQIHDARRNDPDTTTDKYAKYFNQLAVHPGFPGSGLSARKFMDSQQKDMETKPPNRFRDAVFRGQLSGWPTGASPKPTAENFFEYEMNFDVSGMPTPPTVRPLMVRPMGDTPIRGVWDISNEPPRPELRTKPGETKEEIYDSPKSHIKSKTEESLKKGRSDNDDEESQGLPSRKKRSHDQVSYGHRLDDGDPLRHTNIEIKYNPKPVNKDNLSRVNDYENKRTKNNQSTDLEYRISTENSTNEIKQNATLFDKFDVNNESISFEISIIKYLKYLTSSETIQEKVPSNPRKRKIISAGYDYPKRGNAQTKSMWSKIYVGVQEQWHTMMGYIDKNIAAFATQSRKSSAESENIDTSANRNQSAFILNLLPILNNERVNQDKIDTNKSTSTNPLETSTANISNKMTRQTFVTKIIQSVFI